MLACTTESPSMADPHVSIFIVFPSWKRESSIMEVRTRPKTFSDLMERVCDEAGKLDIVQAEGASSQEVAFDKTVRTRLPCYLVVGSRMIRFERVHRLSFSRLEAL